MDRRSDRVRKSVLSDPLIICTAPDKSSRGCRTDACWVRLSGEVPACPADCSGTLAPRVPSGEPFTDRGRGVIESASTDLILGIDPGLSVTGYGLIRPKPFRPSAPSGAEFVEAGVIRTLDTDPLDRRLLEIRRGVEEVLSEYSPTALAVEALYSHYAHPRTAILMGHARGVICCAAASRDIPVLDYAATHIKRSLTGNGRAPKDQVQRAVAFFLGLPSAPEPPDAADALAIALTHLEDQSREAALNPS